MPRTKSKLYAIIKYFETVDLASAQDTLALVREIVKGRTPARPAKAKKPSPAARAMSQAGQHLGASESQNPEG